MSLDRVDELFHEGRGLPSTEWEAFAERECGGDREMKRTLMAMLRTEGEAFAWFDEAEGSLGMFWDAVTPAMIGPYRVVRRLGSGGMGTVYLAEREGEGFVQTVAVKCMRWEGEELLGRFLEERRILSRLEHAGIARFLDGGRTEEGVPYLVMEYVAGETLGAWLQRGQSLKARLRLFSSVGEAVAYAHRRLVVHRDLKPSNVLVMADGQPKLLDFGVAMLLEGREEGASGGLTVGYAAPEQLEGGPITTLTDVYGLGELLYELVTGERAAGPDPGRPKGVGLELGEIACKALARLPADRYQTVDEMLEDLRACEGGWPVRAHGFGWGYRFHKYVRRHWLGVGFLVVLGGAVVGLWWQGVGLGEERERANLVADLVPELFYGVKAGGAVERNLGSLRLRLLAQPLVWADLQEAVGHFYRNAGDRERAAGHYREALAVRRGVLGEGHAAVKESRRHLSDVE